MLKSLFFLLLLLISGYSQQKPVNRDIGILLLVHGGRPNGEAEIAKLATKINKNVAVEIAFGPANKFTIQRAVTKLNALGVKEIIAVPLFISSYNSAASSTRYLLGLQSEKPKKLDIFAALAKSRQQRVEQESIEHKDGSDDPFAPITSIARIRLVQALDSHPIVVDILSDRASSISNLPENEVVILVANTPIIPEEKEKWIAETKTLVNGILGKKKFNRVEFLTFDETSSIELRENTTRQLRSLIETATAEKKRVLVVPYILFSEAIEEALKKRLEGLKKLS